MSTHLHDMNVGQLLSIRGPIPKYKWEENKYVRRSFLTHADMNLSEWLLVEQASRLCSNSSEPSSRTPMTRLKSLSSMEMYLQ